MLIDLIHYLLLYWLINLEYWCRNWHFYQPILNSKLIGQYRDRSCYHCCYLYHCKNIFDVYSSTSVFLLTSSCFRNSSSFSKDFISSVLLLTKSFSCLLNFSSSFDKILIYGINSSYSLDFRASMKALFDCVPVKSFPMLLFDLLEISKSFKIARSVE